MDWGQFKQGDLVPGHGQKPLWSSQARRPTSPEMYEPQTTCSPNPVLTAGRKAVVPTHNRAKSLRSSPTEHLPHEAAAQGPSEDTCLS